MLFEITYEYCSSKMREPKRYVTYVEAETLDEAKENFKQTEVYRKMHKEYESILSDPLYNDAFHEPDKVAHLGVIKIA